MKLFTVKNNKLKTIHHQRAESIEQLVWDEQLWGDRADCEITNRDATDDIKYEQEQHKKQTARLEAKDLLMKPGARSPAELTQILKALLDQ